MDYFNDFLNNSSSKKIMFVISFLIICLTDFYKNVTYKFDLTNTTFIHQYNDTNINKCNYSLKLMHEYKINNAFTYGLVLFFLLFVDFTNTTNRRNFYFITFAILIMNFVFSSFIEIIQFYYNCVELIMDYIPQTLILLYMNYLYTFFIVAIFISSFKYRRLSYIEINNEGLPNDDGLPKYNDIINDIPPPTYTQNTNINTN